MNRFPIVVTKIDFIEKRGYKKRPMVILTNPQGENNLLITAFVSTKNSKSKIEIPTNPENGLKLKSYVCVEKLFTIQEKDVDMVIGYLTKGQTSSIKQNLRELFKL